MIDVIVPTEGEVIFYAVLAIAMAIFGVFAWYKGKKEEERTVTWIRDRNEHNKEEW